MPFETTGAVFFVDCDEHAVDRKVAKAPSDLVQLQPNLAKADLILAKRRPTFVKGRVNLVKGRVNLVKGRVNLVKGRAANLILTWREACLREW